MPSAAIPLLDLNASALSVVIHARQVSCRESLAATLARIDQLNPRFNAIVSRVDGDAVMAQADICNCELAVGQSRGAGAGCTVFPWRSRTWRTPPALRRDFATILRQ